MIVQYENVNRKDLVKAIGKITGIKPKYLGLPTYGYQVDTIFIDKDGNMELGDEYNYLVEELKAFGFEPKMSEDKELKKADDTEVIKEIKQTEDIKKQVEEKTEDEKAESNGFDEILNFTVSMPRDKVTDLGLLNLRRMVANKQSLISKALGTKALGTKGLEIKIDGDVLSFPWFTIEDSSEAIHYATFIEKMIGLANKQQRINKMDDIMPANEKYAFRCFLLRLGLIGKEYKPIRKTLLKNLNGSAAFKTSKGA